VAARKWPVAAKEISAAVFVYWVGLPAGTCQIVVLMADLPVGRIFCPSVLQLMELDLIT
jgi:hypothetical protein